MKFKWKEPKTRIFKYSVGFNPQPSRDDGIEHYIEIHLCCNQYTYYDCWSDGRKYQITLSEFYHNYLEILRKFYLDINRIHNKRLNLVRT